MASRSSSPELSKSSLPVSNGSSSNNGTHSSSETQTSWLATIGPEAETSSVPQRSLTTIFEFRESEEEESLVGEEQAPVSPISMRSPQYQSPGNHWTRLFPELSVVSPIGAATGQSPTNLLSLGAQLENLNSAKNNDSDENFDLASMSCYSRRTSMASMDSEYFPGAERPVRYSILSPVSAGVFDDTASLLPGFPMRRLSKRDSMNKPLPLEPPIKMRPLTLRRRIAPGESSDSSASSSERHLRSPRMRRESELYPGSPTLSQATEDLEDFLANFTKKMSVQQTQALRILDQPLQISRGNMSMIATRPAPQPSGEKMSDRSETSLSTSSKGLDIPKTDKVTLPGDTKQAKKLGKQHQVHFTFPSLSIGGRKQLHGYEAIRSRSSSDLPLETHRGENNEDSEPVELKGKEEGSTFSGLSIGDFPPRPSSAGTGRELLLPELPHIQTDGPESSVKHGSFSRPAQQQTAGTDTRRQGFVIKHTKSKSDGDGLDILFKEKIFVSSNRDHRRQPAEFDFAQAPEILYELDGGLPSPLPINRSGSRKRICDFPVNTPDKAILLIFEHVLSLNDLFSLAVVSKRFYRVFKHHELHLMKEALFKMSPPAWEFREMSPPWDTEWQLLLDPDAQVPEYTPTLYLRRYAQDIYTLVQLKSLILARCGPFLRKDTVLGLAGVDSVHAAEIDDAFWRIWTFCRIFGCGKNRENDVVGQLDWLNGGRMAMDRQKHNFNFSSASVTDPFGMNNVLLEPPAGFGRGNGDGLSLKQLYDMTEIWTCLGVLLQPLHGKCIEARQVGIYKGHDVPVGDAVREENILG